MSRSFIPYRDWDWPADEDREREPEARIRWLREASPRSEGRYVLYWMQMYLRGRANAALDEAIRRAEALDLPVVVYQGLGRRYPEANARIHRFILESARDVAIDLEERGIPYVFYLERGEGRRAAVELIDKAALVVVDDFPAFILPRVTEAALAATDDSGAPVLAFDANGVVPLAEITDRQYAARTIRPRLHRRLPDYLRPATDDEDAPGSGAVELPVEGIADRLPDAGDEGLAELVAECDVDHDVLPSLRHRGGRRAALERLDEFVGGDLARYADSNRDPGADVGSGLSPYLHFGCVSPLEVALRVLEADAPDEAIDAFLEQLVVRRELAYNFCRYTPPDKQTVLDELPDWAVKTMREHADDERDPTYTFDELEAARTHDEIWNAAQRELVATGTFHNYLRMLWGKNIIRWSPDYATAQETMIRLHHRYALDGRNPNTYANILWCFGLHDRAFQETDVLGKLRPMTSRATRRKFDLDPYFERVEEWAAERDMPILRDG